MDYLRDTCGPETASASDKMLAGHIRVSEETGRQLGLVSESAHCRWAFIMCKTNGRVLQSKEAIEYITRRGESPDKRVKQFMVDAAAWLEGRSSRGVRP